MAALNLYETVQLTDKATVRSFLNRDRALMAYALGDLDDAFWPDSIFYGAQRDGEIVSLALVYRGLDPAVLTAFGDAEGVRAIFTEQPIPGEIYYLFPPELDVILNAWYDTPDRQHEWRMVLDRTAFSAPDTDRAVRLGPDGADALAALYKHAAGPGEEVVAFSPWQIAHGVFYGVWDGDDLVAAAGTHVWSEQEGVAAIGNVFTRPDYRGRGYASACTASVTAAGLAAGLDTIILNVRQWNDAAIHIYEKLGYRRYCTFLEGPGLARS